MVEEFIGESKYDGRIRRVTLIKKVAEMLEMEDGDVLGYWKIDGEIVIRKYKRNTYPKLYTFFPQECSIEESKMIISAAFDISDYFRNKTTEPTGSEWVEITSKALSHFPEEYSKEKKDILLNSSIVFAKEYSSRTRIISMHEMEEYIKKRA